jgi:hypothetical protein
MANMSINNKKKKKKIHFEAVHGGKMTVWGKKTRTKKNKPYMQLTPSKCRLFFTVCSRSGATRKLHFSPVTT